MLNSNSHTSSVARLATLATAVLIASLAWPATPARGDEMPYLLVSGYYSSNILAYDTRDATYRGPFVPTGRGGLRNPEGMVTGPDGHLYIADTGASRVKRYHGESGAYLGDFISHVGWPRGLQFGPDGHLYVVSQAAGSVERFDGRTGQHLSTFVPGQYGQPQDLLFRGDHLYVSFTNDIKRFDARTGQYVDVFTKGGGLNGVQGIKFGPDDHLYVADSLNDRVMRFDGATGNLIDEFVKRGTAGLDGTEDVLFTEAGDLLVLSWHTQRVLRCNGRTGEFLSYFAATGDLDGPARMLLSDVPEPTALVALLLSAALVRRGR